MARTGDQTDSLRFSRSDSERLVLALVFSLLAHLAAWGGYEAGKKLGWWQHLPSAAWWHRAEKKNPPPPPPKNPPVTVSLEFLPDVSHPEVEPPKNAKYYSSKNSQAANPDAVTEQNQPKLNGEQNRVVKTEDAPKLTHLQPSAPPPPKEAAKPAPPAPAAEPAKPRGDLEIAKKTAAEPPPKAAAPERPRTVKQALAQQSQQLPGQQMKQAGGVRRQRLWSSLDAKATPFGEYDRAIVEAVTQRWYDLLDSQRFADDRKGHVTVHFKLLTDGRITELQSVSEDVGPLLSYVCQSAVDQAAPFGKWPPDMVRMVGANFREITFTFYYY